MRVFLSFPYALGRVGVGRTALNQVNGLAKRGHEVLVATPVRAPETRLADGVHIFETRLVAGRRIPQQLFLSPKWRFALHDLRAREWLRREQKKSPIDVLHAWPLSGHKTMQAAQDLRIRVVREAPNTHTAHAYDVVEREAASLSLHIPEGNSHYRDPAHLAAEEAEWRLADAILAPSEAVAASFLSRGFPPERLSRHRYGCDVPPPPDETEKAPRPLQALFLGAAEPRKGLHYALEAWSRSVASADGTLIIAGKFMPGYQERLGDLLKTPGVEIHGFVEDPQSLLSAADILLLPSVEEGSAIVTYEAQAVGCIPVVSAQAGAMIEHNVQGLVHQAGDVDALVRQLDEITKDTALRRRLREACLTGRERLSWDAAAEALEKAYRTVVAGSAGL